MFVATALWTRFRQTWFAGAALDVSFDDLVRCPLEPLSRIAALLGWPEASNATLARVLDRTSRSWTRHRNSTGTYRDGLSAATLAWKDAIHANLGFHGAYFSGSCAF